MKTLRQRLVGVLRDEGFSVLPDEIFPATGHWRTYHASEANRWEARGSMVVDNARVIAVTMSSPSTMTDCVRYGVDVAKDSNLMTSFEVTARDRRAPVNILATCSTPHCKGDPSRPGGVVGPPPYCARCYRRQKRGYAPTASPYEPKGLEASLPPVRLSPALLKAAKAAAKRNGVDLSEWVRQAIEGAARK